MIYTDFLKTKNDYGFTSSINDSEINPILFDYQKDIVRWITEDEYHKRIQRYRIEQKALKDKLDNLHTADEDYYTTANYLLNLSKRIPQIFASSKPEIKRRLIDLTLSNPTLNDATICATIRKPFNRWAKGQSCPIWGQLQDVFSNPTNEFKEEILNFNTLLKLTNLQETNV